MLHTNVNLERSCKHTQCRLVLLVPNAFKSSIATHPCAAYLPWHTHSLSHWISWNCTAQSIHHTFSLNKLDTWKDHGVLCNKLSPQHIYMMAAFFYYYKHDTMQDPSILYKWKWYFLLDVFTAYQRESTFSSEWSGSWWNHQHPEDCNHLVHPWKIHACHKAWHQDHEQRDLQWQCYPCKA